MSPWYCHASPMLARASTLLAIWTVASVLLWWAQLTPSLRRKLAVLASALAVVFLVLAVSTEGQRESPTTAVFLLGTPYVTETASASASLPYYVATAACLLLGFAGLAVGDELARSLRRRWLLTAVALSLLVTATRFSLEKVAAPASWTQAVGVTWMAPVVGAFFAWGLRAEGKGFLPLVKALALYALAVRGAIAALMVVASRLRLGSHYDVSALVLVQNPLTDRVYSFEPGSLSQIVHIGVLPQLLVWPVYTVLSGLLGAAVVRFVEAAWRRHGLPPMPPPVPVVPAGQD